jgi:hypothetical protein
VHASQAPHALQAPPHLWREVLAEQLVGTPEDELVHQPTQLAAACLPQRCSVFCCPWLAPRQDGPFKVAAELGG